MKTAVTSGLDSTSARRQTARVYLTMPSRIGQHTAATRWPRVSRAHPCPICGKSDQCKRSPDAGAVMCARVESPRRCGYGWLHRLADASRTDRPLPAPRLEAQRGDDADLDRVYRALLTCLQLDDRHRHQLRQRGLADADVDRAQYRSMPAGCRAGVVRRLRNSFADALLLAVPGVVVRPGPHGRYLTLAGQPGLLVPIRNVKSYVVGMVVRPDEPGDGGKYRWLSSRRNEDPTTGPSPGARVHVPVTVGARDRVIIVEGSLKADVAAALAPGRAIIGLPSCRVTIEAIDTLRILGAREALLALDADAVKNPAVADAQLQGLRRLRQTGFMEGLIRWDPELGKGLDDMLLTLCRARR